MLQTEPSPAGATGQAGTRQTGFRLDIQGLRAVAVLSVVLFHAGVSWLGGGFVGVDVFFVISGFLITGGIVAEVERTGQVSLTQFYVRRVARILPAATVAVVATVALTWLLLPVTRWGSVAKDAAASSLYVVNWSFARDAVDYAALDQAPSPLQHMWSLAVEEQFYIVWPVLLFLVVRLARGRAGRSRTSMLTAMALVAVPSFLWSVRYTAENPSAAYFVTSTRMWELALGAGLAVVAGRPRPERPPSRAAVHAAAVASWFGLAAIAFAVLTFSNETPFPSYRALVPTVGAALLIWSTRTAGPAGPGRLLTTRPMVQVGAMSYSLYLWHWPMLVIAGGVAGPLSTRAGLLVAAAALVPAWLSTRFVERPAQRALRAHARRLPGSPRRALAPAVALTAVSLAAAAALAQAVPSSRHPDISGPVGATVLARGGTISVVDHAPVLLPAVTGAADDLPVVNRNGCMLDHPTTEPKVCSFGDLRSDKVIALVGDSHAAMYLPGLAAVAERAGYRLDTYTKGSCPPVELPIAFDGRDYVGCRLWAANLMDTLERTRPALVITAMSRAYALFGSDEEPVQAVADQLAVQWRSLDRAGIRVAGIRDIPRPGIVVPDCVAAHLDDLSACARPLSDVLPPDDQVTLATRADPSAALLDFTPALCSDMCPAVINDVIVYRDSNHLTATYARTMDDLMARQVLPLLR